MVQYLAVKVNAQNDTNGNPRRGWKMYQCADGAFVGFVDEGYDGFQAVYNVGFPRWTVRETAGEFVIKPREYKALRKEHGLVMVVVNEFTV